MPFTGLRTSQIYPCLTRLWGQEQHSAKLINLALLRLAETLILLPSKLCVSL